MDIKGIVDETYGSIHEIKEIAQEIIIQISKNNLERYKQKGEFDYFEGVYLRDVPLKKQPTELLAFFNQANLSISFLDKETWNIKNKDGHYQGDKSRSRTAPAEIVLYYERSELKPNLDEVIKRRGQDLEYSDIYFKLYYVFTSNLMHELQHAFDDYRSMGKAFKTKPSSQFFSGFKGNDAFAGLDPTQRAYKYKEYLNLPHEVWAHFTQTFKNLRLTTRDFDHEQMPKKMVPLKDVVREFRYEFPNFRLLNPEHQQRLLKAVVSFWHTAKQNLDDEAKAQPLQEVIKREVNVDFANGKIMYDGNPVGVVELFDRNNGYMILDKILIYDEFKGQGIGTAAMKHIMDYARSKQKILTLTPDSVHGGNVNRLKKWYQSLGFVLNKGKNKDFQTMQLFYLPL